jgi:acetyl-CoA carboxylase biotin carboxylase subunit
MPAFSKVLVANRGAVAVRVLRALNDMKIPSVAIYSDVDAGAPYLEMASETVHIGAAPARESYLNQDALIAALKQTHADAVHPGYGFLSENAAFAERVGAAGVHFIGPSPRWLADMGHKAKARELAAHYGLPVGKGSGVLSRDKNAILSAAAAIGYPVLVKPAGGGGGIGMMPARTPEELLGVVERAAALCERAFGTADIYLERFVERPRHVEFQILADRHGNAAHLFERDCSVQRRYQKMIEEAPAPAVDRGSIDATAARLADKLATAGYDNIGTVEMLMHGDGELAFLEMNTRLQVEHGVTEEITGVDLVRAQVRSAAGDRLADILPAKIAKSGHAIEARVYAEDPKRFLPSPGKLSVFRPPTGAGIRIETGCREGRDVTPHYDPMLAKVIVHRATREDARTALMDALRDFHIAGVKSNIPALLAVLDSDEFKSGQPHTGLVGEVIARNDARQKQLEAQAR